MSKKLFALVMLLYAASFVACGDDSSTGSDLDLPQYDSSSSVAKNSSSSVVKSSSSTTKYSSSSVSASSSSALPKSSSSMSGSSSSLQASSSSEDSSSSSSEPLIEDEITDPRDNQVYKIVKIGDQVWMAENLNYEVPQSWCYDDKQSNCETYGRLYTWTAVMDSVNQGGCGYEASCTIQKPHRGICPEGWHVPDNDEWQTFVDFAGTNYDELGFNVLMAGNRDVMGTFRMRGDKAYMWSATEGSATTAWDFIFFLYSSSINSDTNGEKFLGRSLRCIKD